MVIVLPQSYTIQTPTPILNANNGEHYARLMHLSPICLSPLIFVREDDIDIRVDVQTPPVLPLCKFLNHIYILDIVYAEVVDN